MNTTFKQGGGNIKDQVVIRQYVKPVALFIASAFLIYVVAREWLGMVHLHYLSYDYAFFYYAFQSVVHHHATFQDMYSSQQQMLLLKKFHYPMNPNNQYVYPPQFAVLFSWLGWLPYRLSAAVWMMGSVLSYFIGMLYLVRLLWSTEKVRRVHVLALFIAAVVVTPFDIDVMAGNINSLLFLAVCMSFYLLYAKNRPRLAGVPLGLAILFKVTPAAVLLIFFLKKQWRVSTWTLLTVIAGTFISSAFVGWAPILQYVSHFMSLGQTSMKNGPAPYNQSIIGVIAMLQQHGWLFGGKWLQYLFFFAFVIWAMRGIVKYVPYVNDWRLDIAVASLCPLLFSPLVEEMHLLYAVPALMVFIRAAYEHRTLRYVGVISIICVFLLSLPVTFALNSVTSHWPGLAWTHIQMFVVLVLSFSTTLWLYRRSTVHDLPVPPVFNQRVS